MRFRIIPLLFFCFAATASCSSLLGDFAVGGESNDAATTIRPEAGAGASTSAVDAQAPTATVHAAVAADPVYLGQTAVLDASASTTTEGALTFSWSLDSVPAGSHVTLGSVSGAHAATATFLPDTPGTYALHVEVAALGTTDTGSVNLVAALPQVLFAQGSSTLVAGSATYVLAGLDGGGAHPVLCPDLLTGASTPGPAAASYAGRAYDFWEAPPGQPSRFAAFTLDSTIDAGVSSHLWAGTTGSTCASPPVDLGAAGFGPGKPFGSEPHFKPDGSRFVVFDRQWRILTYAADGTGTPRVVASYPVPPPQASAYLDPVDQSGASGYVIEPPRVTWTASGLAWAQPTARGWEIVTAPDTANAALATYMTCPGVTPRQIEMLTDGTVLASYRSSTDQPENLYQLKPDAQRNCTHEQQYTHLGDAGDAIATDFALSPDGTQVAFLQLDSTVQDAAAWTQGPSWLSGGYVYVVPVAGGTPTLVSRDPALFGPRWVAGGTALVFTRLDGVAESTGRPATSVVVMAPDGGGAHAIAQGDGVSTFVSTSGNAACTVGSRSAGFGAALWWALPLLGWALRRERRRD